MRSQRMEALAKGSQIYRGQAMLRKAVKSGERTVIDVLADHRHDLLANKPIGDVLIWQRRYGPARVSQLLLKAGISEHIPCRQITDRQLEVIGDLLGFTDTGRGNTSMAS